VADPTTLRLISFGYLHGDPPTADLVVDVRATLRDPAAASTAGILDLDGRHPRVVRVVATIPGALDLLGDIGAFITTHPGPVCVVAIGYAGGRHRSVALAEMAADLARVVGVDVHVTHQHVHLPRVLHPETNTRRPRTTPTPHLTGDPRPHRAGLPHPGRCPMTDNPATTPEWLADWIPADAPTAPADADNPAAALTMWIHR